MTTGLAMLLAGWWAGPLSWLGAWFDSVGRADLAGAAENLMLTLIERGGTLYGSAFEAFAQTPLFGLAEALANRGGAVMLLVLRLLGFGG
ncbi:MAG: hypothetical protein IKN72_09615 [Clostridia bacterium]|nr:hypothetical protein [Clostridia bacterium]